MVKYQRFDKDSIKLQSGDLLKANFERYNNIAINAKHKISMPHKKTIG